jgi:hypothetical protein
LTIAVEDVITVTAESPMMPGAVWRSKDEAKRKETVAKQGYADEVKTLQQGLVGGVKPLQIAIPETGKLLLLSGVLPPETISVDLEVKGKK